MWERRRAPNVAVRQGVRNSGVREVVRAQGETPRPMGTTKAVKRLLAFTNARAVSRSRRYPRAHAFRPQSKLLVSLELCLTLRKTRAVASSLLGCCSRRASRATSSSAACGCLLEEETRSPARKVNEAPRYDDHTESGSWQLQEGIRQNGASRSEAMRIGHSIRGRVTLLRI